MKEQVGNLKREIEAINYQLKILEMTIFISGLRDNWTLQNKKYENLKIDQQKD